MYGTWKPTIRLKWGKHSSENLYRVSEKLGRTRIWLSLSRFWKVKATSDGFKILSLSVISGHLIMMCLGVDFFGSN